MKCFRLFFVYDSQRFRVIVANGAVVAENLVGVLAYAAVLHVLVGECLEGWIPCKVAHAGEGDFKIIIFHIGLS